MVAIHVSEIQCSQILYIVMSVNEVVEVAAARAGKAIV